MPWERRLNHISDSSYVQVDNKGKKFSQIWSPLGKERNSHNEKGYFVLFYSSSLAPMGKTSSPPYRNVCLALANFL
jgi:hypothetical protein